VSDRDARPELPEELGAKLEAYRAGAMSREEQRAFEREILTQPSLAQDLYEAEGIDLALAAARRSPRRIPRRLLLPVAAAALLLVALLPRLARNPVLEPAPTFRGSETELVALAPTGELSGEELHFRWTRFEGANSYRVEIFDGESKQVLERSAADTLLTVRSEELASLTGAGGFWRVIALGALDSVLATSAPAPLRIHQ